MNRRNAIGNIVILSLGTMVMPSCSQKEEALVKYKNIKVTASDEKMLAQLSEAIIPKSNNFIGAADVKAHEFTLMMLDDCYEPDKQNKYVAGLNEFEKEVNKKYGNGFSSCTPSQKKQWLSLVEKKKDMPGDVQFFYQTTKRHTLQAFTSSQEYMTGVLKYKMVPGSNFKGCVPLKKT
ncbi:MAG: gluconate 2-dehydrogenase subunit 3 family protein [Ferruginibacter sp.]